MKKRSSLLDVTTPSYEGTSDYIPSEELKKAVDIAIRLGRPLLLQGDPGCGKTSLAYSVAFALGLDIEEFYVKSTSRAQDLLYTYDAIRRLYDSQMGDKGPKDKNGNLLSEDISNYIKYGPLGRAIINSSLTDNPKKSVVLIDEIDKADLDFPNDLLFELEQRSFRVAELEKEYSVPKDKPELRPIIFITHNEEKALPPAFLRRCIYFYVEMPEKEEDILKILAANGFGTDEDKKLTQVACSALKRLREIGLDKKPGLSELVDWIGYAKYKKILPEKLAKLCYAEAIVKNRRDQQCIKQHNNAEIDNKMT